MSNATGMGARAVQAVTHVPTDLQVKPHEGFTSTAIAVHNDRITKTAGGRTPILATPPAWMEVEGLNCVGEWGKFDRSRMTFAQFGPTSDQEREQAANMCRGCPLAPRKLGGTGSALGACLRNALEEEEGQRTRYTVRGGMLPSDRAAFARLLEQRREGRAA